MGKCMTANELAILLEVDSWYKLVTREEIATMLRQQDYEIQDLAEWKRSLMEVNNQQQAEIKALKAEKIRAYDNGYEDGRKPNTNKAQEK